MMAVLGMETGIEIGIAGLDAQQITVRTGLKPAAVRFFRLLPDTQGQAEAAISNLLDVPHEVFDIRNKFLILPFP